MNICFEHSLHVHIATDQVLHDYATWFYSGNIAVIFRMNIIQQYNIE